MKNYKCAICGKKNVKLWRPDTGGGPLVCADCAEKLQSPQEYEEYSWKETEDGYVGKPTGRTFPMEKWSVNEKGKIPCALHGKDYNGNFLETDMLIIDLTSVSDSYSATTCMIPAVPATERAFWAYSAVPKERVIWWEALPTK